MGPGNLWALPGGFVEADTPHNVHFWSESAPSTLALEVDTIPAWHRGIYAATRIYLCIRRMAAWPLTVQAQQRVPQIGVLLIGGPEPMGPFYEAMRHRGYIEGRNIQFVVRSGEGDANRLPELATIWSAATPISQVNSNCSLKNVELLKASPEMKT